MPHSNMIQPHFSRDAVERARSLATAAASVSSTSEKSSISSRLKSTLDFSKGMAVMAQVPMSWDATQQRVLENTQQHKGLSYDCN